MFSKPLVECTARCRPLGSAYGIGTDTAAPKAQNFAF